MPERQKKFQKGHPPGEGSTAATSQLAGPVRALGKFFSVVQCLSVLLRPRRKLARFGKVKSLLPKCQGPDRHATRLGVKLTGDYL